MADVELPHIQLAETPGNRPFIGFEGGALFKNTGLIAVRELVEFADEPADAGIEENPVAYTYSYWSQTDGYEINAARERGGRLTTVSMSAPSLNPIVWTGLAMLGRKGSLGSLRADVIPVSGETLAEGELWPTSICSDDRAPVPGTERMLSMDEFERELIGFVGDDHRTVAQLCADLWPHVQNIKRERGPGRTLVVTGVGADLPRLARGMAMGYRRLLEVSGIDAGYYLTTDRVGQMLGAKGMESFNLAWRRGSRSLGRVGAARKVVKELKLLHQK